MSALVALAPGTIFAGDFRVVRKLAAGGMGAVYVAEQISTGRTRALKLMHPGLLDNTMLRQKFEQEARIGARIASDHVVEVVAAGFDKGTNAPWLAMELLEGEDLATSVKRRGAFSPAEVIVIAEQLCHALGAAHAAGIVHRDLKPENVFLATTKRAGTGATVKILDFGIARVVEEAQKRESTGTMGSPYWMAPEQTERKVAVGPTADVWALGLVTFFLLTGKSFWKTAHDEHGSVAQFLRELVIEPIPPASERGKELEVGVPNGFDEWFAKCVTREPKERFADARAAYDGLVAVLGAPTRAHITLPSVSEREAASGPVQITPASPGDMGLAHARTVSIAEEEDEPESVVPVQSGSGTTVFLLVGVVVLVGGGIAALALRPNAQTSTVPPPPSVVVKLTPSCASGMVSIPEGKPTIGAADGEADERPAHEVTLNGFCIDEVEVTVAAYDECVKSGSCTALATKVEWADLKEGDHAFWDGFCNGGKADRMAHPANCVTHDQASKFCAFVHKRLPTEEEWEYAARGEHGTIYPWGDSVPDALHVNACGNECSERANVLGHPMQAMYRASDNWEGTSPVKSFTAGKCAFGAFDMAGNVSEWTSSRYCSYPGNNCSSELRTTRGGSFADEDAKGLRASQRHKDAPTAKSPLIGFRCAK